MLGDISGLVYGLCMILATSSDVLFLSIEAKSTLQGVHASQQQWAAELAVILLLSLHCRYHYKKESNIPVLSILTYLSFSISFLF